MKRARGFTLIELMVSMGLAGLTSVFLLMITRAQLTAYHMNESFADTQLNARAGIDFLENTLRRACGGIAYGLVSVNVNGLTPQIYPCVRVTDGVDSVDFKSGTGSFNAGTSATALTKSDAVDVIYGSTPMTTVCGITASVDANGTAQVCDASGFAANDLVLVSNMNQAFLLRVKVAPTPLTGVPTCPTDKCPNAGTLSFDAAAASVPLPAQIAGTGTPPTPAVPVFDSNAVVQGTWVMKATSLTIYRDVRSNPAQLAVVPDGLAAIDHGNDQPLVQGVENFEVSIGSDTNNDGVVMEDLNSKGTDEWLGNYVTDAFPTSASYFNLQNANPVAPPGITLQPGLQYKQIRATLLVRTTNTYPGTANVTDFNPVEDRNNVFAKFGNDAQLNGTPRYRTARVVVAPRVWNLLN